MQPFLRTVELLIKSKFLLASAFKRLKGSYRASRFTMMAPVGSACGVEHGAVKHDGSGATATANAGVGVTAKAEAEAEANAIANASSTYSKYVGAFGTVTAAVPVSGTTTTECIKLKTDNGVRKRTKERDEASASARHRHRHQSAERIDAGGDVDAIAANVNVQLSTDKCVQTASPKNRKRPSAFRIKTGSLVALRYRPEGNNVQDTNGNSLQETPHLSVVETWIDPIPGYHQGIMIIGCRIRCCFPKSVLADAAVSARILEGDVVGLVNYQHHAAKLRHAMRNRAAGFMPVDLLIDRSSILPFLQCIDKDVDVSAFTENERKRFRYEQTIRGKNKVTVRVNLGISYGVKHCSEGIDNDTLVCKWVIRERVKVPREHGGLTKRQVSRKQFVGNKFDSDAQQELNFRWLASRMESDHTAGRYVGEVMSVRPSCDSLATVTVRVLSLPETTIRGRIPDQSPFELYELDRTREFQVPVEELVVASRKVRRCAERDSEFATISKIYSEERNSWRHQSRDDAPDLGVDVLVCHRCGVEGSEMFVDNAAITSSAISCSKCLQLCKQFGRLGTFLKSCRCQRCSSHHAVALCEAFKMSKPITFVSREIRQMCAVCCLYCKSGMLCGGCGIMIHKHCAKWMKQIDSRFASQTRFLCRTCHPVKQDLHHAGIFISALSHLKQMGFTDFDLPPAFAAIPSSQPADKPIVALKPRGKKPRQMARPLSTPCNSSDNKHRRKPDHSEATRSVGNAVDQHCENKFVESCLRLLPYDPIKGSFERTSKHQAECHHNHQDLVRNLRSVESMKMEEKKTAVRAARASQRRIMKDVAAFGSSFLELDALAGRESHLRFDRSGIHAWGVFADQEIREGEVIVEYRGEIIGNAIAEKRETEYIQAKIGSDYMFRMDSNTVCDATKRGNVARYINASCDPNCYTQIISINNSKRIVIYAKKDIPVGQELCYDYKFPVEFDEAKRVVCYCGAKDCRGFMNWDKRYISVAAPTQPNAEPKSRKPTVPNLDSAPIVGRDALPGPKS